VPCEALLVGARCAPYNEPLLDTQQLEVKPGSLGKAIFVQTSMSQPNMKIIFC
jgi:hypothetical protein